MKQKKAIVVQSNEFIRNGFYKYLSLTDIKIFKAIVSKINNKDSLFEEFYTIDYDNLDDVGITNRDRFKTVEQCLMNLANFYIEVKNKDDDTVKLGLIRNQFIYKKNTSKIIVEISELLKPYLLDLNKEYTKYNLEVLKGFKSKYSLKLYELLRSWKNKGEYHITIDNLREYLEISVNKYKLFGSFKSRILNTGVGEINSYSDIEVSYNLKKNNNGKVIAIVFLIDNNILNEKDEDTIDLTLLLNKLFIDNSGRQYLVKEYIQDKNKDGYYNLKLLNTDKGTFTKLPNSLKKKDLFDVVFNKTEELIELEKRKKNINKLNNLLGKGK